jgi:hypothetical protein
MVVRLHFLKSLGVIFPSEHDHQDHDLCMIKVLTIVPLPVIILKITSEERYEMHVKGPTTDRSVPEG